MSARDRRTLRQRWDLWLVRTGRWHTRRWTVIGRMLGGS